MDGPKAAPDVDLRAAVNSGPESLSACGSPHGDPIDLSLIVVTFNSSSVLDGLISSLTNHPPTVSWELIICDNGSHDNSVALIRALWPNASILASDANHGFATAVNTAEANARGRWLFLANPDISWGKGVLDRLIRFLDEHPAAGAVSPRLTFPDGRPQPSIRRFPNHANIWLSRGTPWSALTRSLPWVRAYTLPDPHNPVRVEAVSAASLMLRREAFRAVAGMDPDFFLYVEDTDLCRRLGDQGWEVWVDPTITVTHRWGGAVKQEAELRAYHRQSVRHYFRKHHPDKPVRNAILFSALSLADWCDHVTTRNRPAEPAR
jgi:hypothetical protein